MSRKMFLTIAIIILTVTGITIAATILQSVNSSDDKSTNEPATPEESPSEPLVDTTDDEVIQRQCEEAAIAYLRQDYYESSSARQERLAQFFTPESPAITRPLENIRPGSDPPVYNSSAIIKRYEQTEGDAGEKYCFIHTDIAMRNTGADIANSVKYEEQVWFVMVGAYPDRVPTDIARYK